MHSSSFVVSSFLRGRLNAPSGVRTPFFELVYTLHCCRLRAQAIVSDVALFACTQHIEERSSVWKHSWMCISQHARDDEPAIWVWVNEILLDSSNEALVFDCCIMPVERMGDAASAQLIAAVEFDNIRGDGAGIAFEKVIVLDVDGGS